MSEAPIDTEQVQDWPLFWFARLEAAIEHGDHQLAAEAQRALQQLGVTVTYCARHRDRMEATNNAS
jgi:hypothetical protein